jgi:hypothetical protein
MTLVKKTAGLSLVGLAATAMTAPGLAQDAPPAVNNGLLTWSAGVDVVTSYIFRGIEQENQGLIIQPFVEVGAPLGDSGIDFSVGTWSSIHSEGTASNALDPTGDSADGSSRWYEADLYASLGYSVTEQLAVAIGFTGYYSPNNAFADIEELTFGIEFDDSEAMGDFAFAPYALLAVETRDAGGTEDIYLELGGEFGAPFIESEDIPVALSFPFAVGLSVDDYYTDNSGDNELFGYFLVGAAASLPLDFIPADYGTWTASAGIDVIFANDDAGLEFSGGDDIEIVGKVGVGLEY